MCDSTQRTKEVADILKLMGNPHRFAVICALTKRRYNVTELMKMVGIPQTAMSNQLAKMREAGLVDCEVRHRERLYYIADPRVLAMMKSFSEIFAEPSTGSAS